MWGQKREYKNPYTPIRPNLILNDIVSVWKLTFPLQNFKSWQFMDVTSTYGTGTSLKLDF